MEPFGELRQLRPSGEIVTLVFELDITLIRRARARLAWRFVQDLHGVTQGRNTFVRCRVVL